MEKPSFSIGGLKVGELGFEMDYGTKYPLDVLHYYTSIFGVCNLFYEIEQVDDTGKKSHVSINLIVPGMNVSIIPYSVNDGIENTNISSVTLFISTTNQQTPLIKWTLDPNGSMWTQEDFQPIPLSPTNILGSTITVLLSKFSNRIEDLLVTLLMSTATKSGLLTKIIDKLENLTRAAPSE